MNEPTIKPGAGRIAPSRYEKNEWSRLASDAYSKDLNDIGHKFSAAASLENGASVSLSYFDELQEQYRQWLISGFPNPA